MQVYDATNLLNRIVEAAVCFKSPSIHALSFAIEPDLLASSPLALSLSLVCHIAMAGKVLKQICWSKIEECVFHYRNIRVPTTTCQLCMASLRGVQQQAFTRPLKSLLQTKKVGLAHQISRGFFFLLLSTTVRVRILTQLEVLCQIYQPLSYKKTYELVLILVVAEVHTRICYSRKLYTGKSSSFQTASDVPSENEFNYCGSDFVQLYW